MKIILAALIGAMLLVGMVAAADAPVDLSTLSKKAEIAASMTPVVIEYSREATTATTDAVDVRTLSRSFGTFTNTTNIEPVEISASTPVTYTPSFSISVSNTTFSSVTLYTPPFSIGNNTISTPSPMIFGGF